MDRFAEKQADLEAQKAAAARQYPHLWQHMVSEWSSSVTGDQVWLMYAANYLFHTAGVRWALDPLTLRQRIPSAPEVDISPLAALDYVVLTHRHADHLDLELLRRLQDFPVRWIVPEFLLASLKSFNLPGEKLIIPRPLEALQLGGLTLTPFTGLHYELAPNYPDGLRGPPAMGYLADFNSKRWLIPGDTRTYLAGQLPAFEAVDGLFAHLWLGRSCALQDEPPLSAAFCQFCLDLSPRRILLTHLDEFGRNANEYWDNKHAWKVKKFLQTGSPEVEISIAQMGDKIAL
jgi:L-ascorbate metabolism protein UlaG (beta-lactamase superfamily)